MSYAFNAMKRQISEIAEGNGKYTIQELDEMIYEKYQKGRLSDREYQDLCTLLEFAE